MPALRIKKIEDTLKEVADRGLFFSVKPKSEGEFSTNRTKISTCSATFEKNPKVVYSPATHLMGEPKVIEDFLEARRENSDTSADSVLDKFTSDTKKITSSNVDKPASKAYIEEITRKNEKYSKENPKNKSAEIPLDEVVSIYELAKDTKYLVKGYRGTKENPVGEIISQLKDNKDQAVRIHGFSSNGLVSNKPLKIVPRAQIGKNAKAVGNDFPLSHFFIQPQTNNRTFVKTFLKYYYTHVEKDEDPSQRANDETDLIIPEKKVLKKRTGRSTSPQSKSSAGKKSKSASPDSRRSKSNDSVKSVSDKGPTRSRSADSVVSRGSTNQEFEVDRSSRASSPVSPRSSRASSPGSVRSTSVDRSPDTRGSTSPTAASVRNVRTIRRRK